MTEHEGQPLREFAERSDMILCILQKDYICNYTPKRVILTANRLSAGKLG